MKRTLPVLLQQGHRLLFKSASNVSDPPIQPGIDRSLNNTGAVFTHHFNAILSEGKPIHFDLSEIFVGEPLQDATTRRALVKLCPHESFGHQFTQPSCRRIVHAAQQFVQKQHAVTLHYSEKVALALYLTRACNTQTELIAIDADEAALSVQTLIAHLTSQPPMASHDKFNIEYWVKTTLLQIKPSDHQRIAQWSQLTINDKIAFAQHLVTLASDLIPTPQVSIAPKHVNSLGQFTIDHECSHHGYILLGNKLLEPNDDNPMLSGYKAVGCLFHEMFHAWQHHQIKQLKAMNLQAALDKSPHVHWRTIAIHLSTSLEVQNPAICELDSIHKNPQPSMANNELAHEAQAWAATLLAYKAYYEINESEQSNQSILALCELWKHQFAPLNQVYQLWPAFNHWKTDPALNGFRP